VEVKQMRNWMKALTSTPRGFAADGRRLGLGLATAMEMQRRQRTDAARQVVRHLGEQPAEDRSVKTAA
jgi:hypothetical protein